MGFERPFLLVCIISRGSIIENLSMYKIMYIYSAILCGKKVVLPERG